MAQGRLDAYPAITGSRGGADHPSRLMTVIGRLLGDLARARVLVRCRETDIVGALPIESDSARRGIHPGSLLCSQKIVSIERYIVVAMAKCSWAAACRRVARACQDPGGNVTSGRIPRFGKCQRLGVVGLTKLVEPMGRDAIVARLVHAVGEQSGPTKRMIVPGESVDHSPPAKRLVLDVAFGQPQGIASCSAH